MRIPIRDLGFLAAIAAGAAVVVGGMVRPMIRASASATSARAEANRCPEDIVRRVDAAFRRQWTSEGLAPAGRAPELAIVRRISLALCGTIPSLEEIRRLEALPEGRRADAWLDEILRDRRSADYLAERFARVLVGTEDGPFLKFRRRRFVTWLSDAILANRPYHAIVRDLIADRGLWTDHPATNFLTVTIDEKTERPTPERLAARTARAFLGVRLDCAQCHDHPFQPWKQGQFRGLAAFFGASHCDLRGIRDTENDYRPTDRKGKELPTIEPEVPFLPELLPPSTASESRTRLAGWVVDPRNPALARVTVNRLWALLLGRPLAEPVDDLPASGELHPALTMLADDFASHGYDLRRLIRVIASTEVFRLDSADDAAGLGHEAAWAVFPICRLRPEQVAGAVFQAGALSTLGPESHWFTRFLVFSGRNDFVHRYGDTGEDEFDARAGTIPQRLLMMNGKIVRERIEDGPFPASSSLARLAPDDRQAVEAAYLVVLTRRPTDEELGHFIGRLDASTGDERKHRIADLFWTLINSTEFSWNH